VQLRVFQYKTACRSFKY